MDFKFYAELTKAIHLTRPHIQPLQQPETCWGCNIQDYFTDISKLVTWGALGLYMASHLLQYR